MQNKIIVISGSTASGKSALALDLAQEINGIIINADSVQLYKNLPILSAQPSPDELKLADHKLYSVLNYDEPVSVAIWLEMATAEINKAFKAGKTPIVVGGTGLYISKLIDGINEIPEISGNSKEYVANIFNNSGKDGLIKDLLSLGDEKEKVINLDKQRLMRRLEIFKDTAKSLDYWQSLPKKTFYDRSYFIHINLEPDRDLLYQNCDKRYNKMLENGAIKEVKDLLRLKPSDDSGIIKTIGFLEIKDYLLEKIDKKELVEKATQKTRNYAKRQLTWFRNQFDDKIIINNVSRETLQLIKNLL